MSVAIACSECGSPVYPEDRFCGSCGSPRSSSLSDAGASALSRERAGKLLAELRALTAGEYEIRGEIGRGGMAVVYLAYDLRLNRKVAIKVMLPDLAFHTGMEERFKREARTAARLDHPNIVVIHSVRDSGDPLFFVMKYVDGAPLDVVIRDHAPLPIPMVQGILVQLCAALQHAHNDGVIHRDVKPANILIDTHGNVQVTDFGIAKAADSAHLTRTGLSIGTPTYMCPEQCKGHPQTPASDQYSVGIVAYEMLTGHPPFRESGVAAQWAHLERAPVDLTIARPDCPPSLALAVMRMLAKDPADRWPTLRDALSEIGQGLAPEAEGGRPALARLVRVSPPDRPRPGYDVTPRTPVPHRAEPIARLDVATRHHTLEVGKTERIRCRTLDSQGRELIERDARLEWSSSNPTIASVDESGVVTAHRAGTVTIAAMFDALAAMATVQVVPAVAVSPAPEARPGSTLGIVPTHPTATVGEDLLLGAKLVGADGRAVEASTVAWRSLTPAIATVDSRGLVVPRRAGTATIVASSGGLETRVEIPVTASESRRLALRVGAGVGVAAAAMLAFVLLARRPNDAPPTVVSAAGAVAPSSAPPAAAVAPPGVTSSATPAVPAAAAIATPATPIDTVIASLETTEASPIAMEVGAVRSLAVQALNKSGEQIPAAHITWELSNPAVVSVESDGVMTATATGRTLVTARAGELTRVVAVDVREASGNRMRIAIARDSLRVGDSTTVMANVFDRRDTRLSPTITWRSSNASVASVDARGVVRAEGAGQATLFGTMGSLGDSVSVFVSEAPAVTSEPKTDSTRVTLSENDARLVVDSIVAMIGRRVVRVAQLTRGAGEPGAQFVRFLDENTPSPRLAGPPVVSDVGATSARVAFSIILEWEAPAKRERTVSLESVVDAVRGGWSIREIQFPSGFAPQ